MKRRVFTRPTETGVFDLETMLPTVLERTGRTAEANLPGCLKGDSAEVTDSYTAAPVRP